MFGPSGTQQVTAGNPVSDQGGAGFLGHVGGAGRDELGFPVPAPVSFREHAHRNPGPEIGFDGGNRVPCIVYWKGHTQPGTICNRLAVNIDLFPTFAEITGAPLPERKIDGVSILSLIEGQEGANPRESFVYYYHKNDLEAVTDGEFKLVFPHRYVTYGAYAPGNDGMPGQLENVDLKASELYDLRRDPGERYNVLHQYPERAAKLMRIADEKRRELGDNLTRVKGTENRQPGLVNN